MKKNKNILIFLWLGIVLIVSMFFVLNKSHEYHELPKVKIKEPLKNKQFALMLEQTKGERDYKESSSNELPLGGYKFNEEKSGCTDINGKVVENALSYDYDNYMVILNTNKTLYCYLYYDKDNIINYLRSKDSGNNLSAKLVGDMHRYQGLYTDEINNYICLGDNCCKTTECDANDNDDMYRIIGINTKGELKVIKKTALSDGVKWMSNVYTNFKWPQSNIYQKLNGKSVDGPDNYNLEDENSYYYSLDSKLKELIVNNHSWLYGDTIENGNYNGDSIYGIESENSKATYYIPGDIEGSPTGNNKWSERIEVPLGLMYVSDYLYAYKTNEEDSGDPKSNAKAASSWMHISHNQLTNSYEWTMIRYGIYPVNGVYHALGIASDGGVYALGASNVQAIRPTFYLSNEIDLTGEGSLSNPFRIPGIG